MENYKGRERYQAKAICISFLLMVKKYDNEELYLIYPKDGEAQPALTYEYEKTQLKKFFRCDWLFMRCLVQQDAPYRLFELLREKEVVQKKCNEGDNFSLHFLYKCVWVLFNKEPSGHIKSLRYRFHPYEYVHFFFNVGDENLSITNLTCTSTFHDGLDDFIDKLINHNNFNFNW